MTSKLGFLEATIYQDRFAAVFKEWKAFSS